MTNGETAIDINNKNLMANKLKYRSLCQSYSCHMHRLPWVNAGKQSSTTGPF